MSWLNFLFRYWVHDVVAARAAWDPCVECASDGEAFMKLLEPVVSYFGDSGADLGRELLALAESQRRLLINPLNLTSTEDVSQRNWMAYLQGIDAFADLENILAGIGCGGFGFGFGSDFALG